MDHIISRAVAPEPDEVTANLELPPLKLNLGKRDPVGKRQLALAREFRAAACKAGRLEEVRRWLRTPLEWGGKEMKSGPFEDAGLGVLWIGE